MSVQWDKAIEERLCAKSIHPIDKAAADLGLTTDEYLEWLDIQDEARYWAEYNRTHADKQSLWQRITSKLQGANHNG